MAGVFLTQRKTIDNHSSLRDSNVSERTITMPRLLLTVLCSAILAAGGCRASAQDALADPNEPVVTDEVNADEVNDLDEPRMFESELELPGADGCVDRAGEEIGLSLTWRPLCVRLRGLRV